jgi:hypothetical protein
MGLVFEQARHMPHTWEKSSQAGHGTRNHYAQRMESVSFGGTLASLEDEIAPLLHLDMAFGGL